MSDERKRAEFLLRTQKYAPDADLVSPVVDAMLAFAAEEVAKERKEAFNAGMTRAAEICKLDRAYAHDWTNPGDHFAELILKARDEE